MLIDDILKYANDYDLFIFDINGVLDNNHNAKVQMLRNNFPNLTSNSIANIIIDMERFYESDKSSGTSSHIEQALRANGIIISVGESEHLANDYFNLNRIKPEIINLMNNLSKDRKVCLYTSLPRVKVDFITSLCQLSSNIMIFASEDQIEQKPSIRNLHEILRRADHVPEKAILFGDNVAVDIMPANLAGIKSVLVSNYVDAIIKL